MTEFVTHETLQNALKMQRDFLDERLLLIENRQIKFEAGIGQEINLLNSRAAAQLEEVRQIQGDLYGDERTGRENLFQLVKRTIIALENQSRQIDEMMDWRKSIAERWRNRQEAAIALIKLAGPRMALWMGGGLLTLIGLLAARGA